MKTIHVRIEGRVQGVFFRDYTRKKAVSLNLNGWVKNLPDGAVEAVFSGNDDNITEMVTWLHDGSPHSNVSKVTVSDYHEKQNITNFKILF